MNKSLSGMVTSGVKAYTTSKGKQMIKFTVEDKNGVEVECVAFEETATKCEKHIKLGVKCNLRVRQGDSKYDSVIVVAIVTGDEKGKEHWWDRYMREEFGGDHKHRQFEKDCDKVALEDGKVRCWYRMIDPEKRVWASGWEKRENCIEVEGFFYLRNLIPQEAYGRKVERKRQSRLVSPPRAISVARAEEVGEDYPDDYSGSGV